MYFNVNIFLLLVAESSPAILPVTERLSWLAKNLTQR
uniref:Uncharacterized protein n=1 Tax=Tetranychus urticae TaxID=32264 RepID=T1KKB9_TETUR